MDMNCGAPRKADANHALAALLSADGRAPTLVMSALLEWEMKRDGMHSSSQISEALLISKLPVQFRLRTRSLKSHPISPLMKNVAFICRPLRTPDPLCQ